VRRRAPIHYTTKLEKFRRQHGIRASEWAHEAGIPVRQLTRYRSGRGMPRTDTLAILVRAARKITGQGIRAQDLVDVGDEEPLNPSRDGDDGSLLTNGERDQTRINRCMTREGVRPARLAREAGVSRQNLLRLRTDTGRGMSVTVLRALVTAMRRMGKDVRASDVADLGEDTE
jgi:predicted transcriptional regulator